MFFVVYTASYFLLYFCAIKLILTNVYTEKKMTKVILMTILTFPSVYAIYILNTLVINLISYTRMYSNFGNKDSIISSINNLKAVYIILFQSTFNFLISYGRIVSFVFLFLSQFIFIKICFEKTESIRMKKSAINGLFKLALTVQSFLIYPISKGIGKIIEEQKEGTTRILKEGSEVIRDTKAAEERLRQELMNIKRTGISFIRDIKIPYEMEASNFLYMGGMGSGKTLAFIMRILRQFYNRGNRTIVADIKGDFTRVWGEETGVKIFTPLDSRSIGWDISKDLENELEALEFLRFMIPVDSSGSSAAYFQLAAIDITLGIIIYLQNEKPRAWNLVDIFNTMNNKNLLIHALQSYRSGALDHIADSGFDEQGNFVPSKLTVGIFSDIRAHLQNLEFLAKAWPTSCGGFSIKKYARGEIEDIKMIILPFNSYYKSFSEFFVAMILDFFFRSVFSLPENYEERIGIFLDELGVLPKIPSFVEATKTLRTRGGSLHVAFQDCGVVDSKYKSDGGTEAIFNGFGSKCIGLARTPQYAEYFVRAFGKNTYEKITKTKNEVVSEGKRRVSMSTQYEKVVEDAVATGELLALPKASKENPIATFFIQLEGISIIFKLGIPTVKDEERFEPIKMADWINSTSKSLITIDKKDEQEKVVQLPNDLKEEVKTEEVEQPKKKTLKRKKTEEKLDGEETKENSEKKADVLPESTTIKTEKVEDNPMGPF